VRYVIPKLKRWAGLYRNADVGALFRRRKHMGLQLTSLELHYQRLQVVKCCLLQSSKDANVRAIYEQCKERVVEYNNRWSGPKELANLEPIVEHNFRFAGQHGTAGLGSNKSNPYIANPTEKQRREKIAETLVAQHEEDHIRHASCLSFQGSWTHWEDCIPFDLSWDNLIHGPNPRVISFLMNAQINSVVTPVLLALWGKIPSAKCVLCDAEKCSLHHILVHCKYSLDQGRYNWRHDSVLLNIESALTDLISNFNQKTPVSVIDAAKKAYSSSFVRPCEKKKGPVKALNQGCLSSANDWKLLVDYANRQMIFPPVICATNQRPDIVIWSMSAHEVIMLELTVCA